MVINMEQICASAKTPDQLLPYVRAVSGLDTIVSGECLLHHAGGHAVLVGYPHSDPQNMALVEDALASAQKMNLERITVIAPAKPACAPDNAEIAKDTYWSVPVPLRQHSGKLRNMLKRAAREVEITTDCGKNAWTGEHGSLVDSFCQRKTLSDGTVFIFNKMAEYLSRAPDAILFSASKNGKLVACAIGDYTALSTAFYMFAFRLPTAPPGTADLLLASIVAEADRRGHARVNLGLGIGQGVEFFKRKWGAEPFLPCVESSWNIKSSKKGFLSRFFGKASR